MPRRSLRLYETGYYKDDGTPIISYREGHFKVFKKRKFVPQKAGVEGPLVKAEEWRVVWIPPKISCCPLLILAALLAMAFTAFWSFKYQTVIQMQHDMASGLIYRDLLPIEADAMPNFALPSHGATVVKGQSSDTYIQPGTGLGATISSWLCSKQMAVIEPRSPLVPGWCWPFEGDRGRLQVRLADTIKVTHVTLGHISKLQSFGSISSAPRRFSVYGLKTVDSEATLLGSFEYNQDGPSFQTFTLPDNSDVFRHIRLDINNNWGNEEYTCLYSFRVHGKVPTHAPTL